MTDEEREPIIREILPDTLLTRSQNGRLFLAQPFRYIHADGAVFVIPEGFMTDLASTPRITWPLWPPFGKHERAAVVHDWLCVKEGRVFSEDGQAYYFPSGHIFDGKDGLSAADIFGRLLKLCGVNPVRRALFIAGVKTGGPIF